MERLTYEKINNSNDAIKIDLHNGYSIIAISGWNQKKKCYTTTLSLKDNTIDVTELIEKAELLEFYTDHKTINSAILKQVSIYLDDGFFDYYINRYRYRMDCLDMIDDLLDKGRLLNAS